MKLQGKVALITGGTTGIGLETAALFHAEGARVFVTGRNADNIAEAKKRLPKDVAVWPADELAPRGIRVNEVSPGPIETPIFTKMGMSAEEAAGVKGMMQQGVPLKRLGTPEEVARAALFLASDDSTYLLGAKIRIDGGFALN